MPGSKSPEGDTIVGTIAVVDTQLAPTRPSKNNKCPGTRLEMWSSKALVDNLHDNGTISGGTGCTVDFGSTSEKVIELMTHQAQINHTNMVLEQQEKAIVLSGQEDTEIMQDRDETFETFDDASLEAMVEDLVAMPIDLSAANPFFEEDDDDLGLFDETTPEVVDDGLGNDSGLRQCAPAFVPGQMWTGSQRSAFID
jgi:hypothetical protein